MTQPPRIRRDPRDPASARSRAPIEALTRVSARPLATVPDGAPFVLTIADLPAGRLSRDDRDMLGAARTLADSMSGGVALLAFLPTGLELRALPGREGVDRVVELHHPSYVSEDAEARLAGALAAAGQCKACHLLFPDTALGTELARRVAARLGDRAAFDVRRLAADELTADIDAGKIELRRPLPRVIVPGRAMFAPPSGTPLREARSITVDAEPSPPRLRVGASLPLDPATLPLAEAELIISAGNGLIDWQAFHKAAGLLGAAEAGSRVVCDAGLLPRSRQVGASGMIVEPRCYIAFGIAGASQHLQGIAAAERVIAVNTDLRAEMIKRADLAIIADAQAVLPALVRRTEARRQGWGAADGSPLSTSLGGDRAGTNQQAQAGAPKEGGEILCLVSVGRHPISGRARRADLDSRALELALATGLPANALHAGVSGAADAALKDYLGAGAHEVVLVSCAGREDPIPVLEAEIALRKPCLVVAGSRAEIGEGSGMVPFLLAERLGYALVTDVVDIAFTQTGTQIVKAMPGGRRRILETDHPLIVTVDRRGPAPRLSARMPAQRGRLQEKTGGPRLADESVGWSTRPGRPRPRRLIAPSLGGASDASDARREMIAADPDAAADAILDFLERDGLLAIAKQESS